MTFEEVKKYIEENKDTEEVKGFLDGFKTPVTAESVQAYLDTDEGRKILQPINDRYFTKGLETWKEKSFPSLLEDEIKKRFPDETPEQKEIREMKEQLNQVKQERQMEALKAVAIQKLTEKKLPTSMLQFVLKGDTEEAISSNIEGIEKEIATAVKALTEEEVNKRFNSSSQPRGNEAPDGKSLSRDEFDKLDPSAQMKAVKDGYQITEAN